MRVKEQRGLKVEITSTPPSAQGFVPVQWRWVKDPSAAALDLLWG
jgi:hypothetical protein